MSPFYSRLHIWSGIYVGVNAGAAFGTFSSNATAGPFTADLGSVDASGFIGGGQVGAQMQYQNFVYGVEADFQGSSQDHTDNFVVLGVPASLTASMPWFATVRGRLGYAVDNVLLYGTGGIAIVDGKLSASALGITASREDSHIGWTAGAGYRVGVCPALVGKG
jgi:outer membrane immunogenic protein